MLLQQSIEHVSIVHTNVSPILSLVHVIYSGVSGQCSYTITVYFMGGLYSPENFLHGPVFFIVFLIFLENVSYGRSGVIQMPEDDHSICTKK